MIRSVDKKPQIQALGRAGTLTRDYVRHGTTTVFAALNVLDGTLVGQCRQRHRHQEFLRFLNRLEREIPAGKLIHVVLDRYGSHKHPKVRAWLARHPRCTLHFTPTSASPRRALPCVPVAPDRSRCDRWLNAVESFFARLTQRRLKRGVFHSLVDLRYLAEHNNRPLLFVWTAKPNAIIAATKRGYQTLDSIR